jgi:hypothetical protein
MTPMLMTFLLAAGCVAEREVFVESLPAEGVTELFCDNERGSFFYSGSNPDAFDLQVTSWGSGISRGAARARLGTNEWGAVIEGNLLDLWGRSPEDEAGIDLALEGPPAINIESVLLDGVVELVDVVGTHVITANGIVGSGLSGHLDLYATSDGVDIETFPEPGASIQIQSYGEVTLRLPYGLDYDIEVFADPDWGAEVSELGFDELTLAPDYVSAKTGNGSIHVDVTVAGGPFRLWLAE